MSKITDDIVNNNLITALGRVTMVVLLPLMAFAGYVATLWLENAISPVRDRMVNIELIAKEAKNKADQVATDLTAMKATIERGRQERDKDSIELLSELKEQKGLVLNLLQRTAGMEATLSFLRRQTSLGEEHQP